MATVAKNTTYLTAALIGQKVLSFIYFSLLARFLGVELIGTYTFVLAFTTMFSVVSDLGLTPVLIREVAREKEASGIYIRTIIGLKIALSAVAYGALLMTAFLLGHSGATLLLIGIAGGVMLLDTFHLTLYGVLRGKQILKYESIGMVLGQGVTLLLGLFALVVHATLPFFIAALALGSLGNAIFSYRVLSGRGFTLSPVVDKIIAIKIARYALPFALSGIFVRVYSYIDTVFLQHMRGNVEVGWYSIPYKITYAFQFIPLALSAAVYPALAHAWHADRDRARWIFERALRYCLLISLPIATGIFALAKEIILTVYGTAYLPSIKPLSVSIFSLVFIFLYFPIGALLNATDRQHINTTFMGLSMVASIIMNLLLIPSMGAVGASISALVTSGFLFLSTFIWSQKRVRSSASLYSTAGKVLLASLSMLYVVWYAKQYLFWPFTIPLGGVVYLAMLVILRTLKKDDLKDIVKMFRKEPIEMEA